MQDFRNLRVWERAHELTLEVYRLTAAFPKTEIYGLVTQMRRACVSIGANIAEGCGRTGNTELRRFLRIAMGSVSELQYELLVSRDLSFVAPAEYTRVNGKLLELKKMMARFIGHVDCSATAVLAGN